MAGTPQTREPLLAIDELRDLYERIPFVRGRTRAELLRRLHSVRRDVRDARLARLSAPESLTEAAGH